MDIYKQYAEVKLQLEILEKKSDELKTVLLQDLKKRGIDKEENDYGKFTLCIRKKWIYSKKIQKFEEDIKKGKIDEQENGMAEVEESEYIKFNPPIHEDNK